MMLEFLGEKLAAEELMRAIATITGSGFLTRDLGGDASTLAFTDRVLAEISSK
jgi:isocitrate/isopropylmalate dehydrogenase